jgi:uncharacterized membrane protein
MSVHETRSRSVVKSLSWRFVATLTTVVLVYAFTGAVHVALAVGGIEVVAKLLIFYVHERVWAQVGWGIRA